MPPFTPELLQAVADYLGGLALGKWRARAEVRAAAEVALGVPLEVEDVSRLLWLAADHGALQHREVVLAPGLVRHEFRRRRQAGGWSPGGAAQIGPGRPLRGRRSHRDAEEG